MGVHLLDDLPRVLEGYREQIHKTVDRIAQRAALVGGDYLARETPVDTGYARSNWVGTINEPFIGTIPAYVPYPTYRPDHHQGVKELSIRNSGRSRVRVLRSPGS